MKIRISRTRALALLSTVVAVLLVISLLTRTSVIPMYRGHFASYWRESIIREQEVELSVFVPALADTYRENGALSNDGDSEAVPLLIELAKDEDPRVRAFTAVALGRRKETNDRILSVLRELATDADFNVSVDAKGALAAIRNNAHPELFVPPVVIPTNNGQPKSR